MLEVVQGDLWIFGYGSLIWRPAFPYRERHPGYIEGFKRRFWQQSTDHRGTPEAPGRVVTLLAEPGEVCWGMAYRVADEDRESVLARLDFREKGGYQRVYADVLLDRDNRIAGRPADPSVRALVYVATAENPNYAGPEPIEDIARIVQRARGPSGTNLDYVMRLADALQNIGACDPHVIELARRACDSLHSEPADAPLDDRARGVPAGEPETSRRR
ncbi:MAG: gamma-glutamylcyclotransferase [Proteobacteria bacterium]|nr:gamma-glutamylcyclotransferase [Pseudomonadota bacterium]